MSVGAGGSLFINDSKATNADAAARALACFHDIFWIAGGKPKAGGIESLRDVLSAHPQGLSDRRGGNEFRRYAWTARCPMRSTARSTGALAAAARDAARHRRREPVVLLSPACASYDQFKNFEQFAAMPSGPWSAHCPA